jgi:transcriptional regulator with XRE-family HTH domain
VDRQAVHDFLVSRRARITPAQAGMPTYGEKRRVPGLRREEVASLAGVSFDYYARLERGNLSGVSDPVLEALAKALQLDEAERQHLFDLAKAASLPASRFRPAKPPATRVRPAVLSILNGMTGTPAYVRNTQLDILAANDLCLALYDGVLTRDDLPFNLARFVFLDPYAKAFFLDWDTIAQDTVGSLRTQAGRDPSDRGLSDLIGELTTRSDGHASRIRPNASRCCSPGDSVLDQSASSSSRSTRCPSWTPRNDSRRLSSATLSARAG